NTGLMMIYSMIKLVQQSDLRRLQVSDRQTYHFLSSQKLKRYHHFQPVHQTGSFQPVVFSDVPESDAALVEHPSSDHSHFQPSTHVRFDPPPAPLSSHPVVPEVQSGIYPRHFQ